MDEKFDFGDGKGEVPAQKHANGGGWVAKTAHVEDSAFVCVSAKIYGETEILNEAEIHGF